MNAVYEAALAAVAKRRAEHSALRTASHKAWAAAGRCYDCGTRDTDGCFRCERCRERVNARRRAGA